MNYMWQSFDTTELYHWEWYNYTNYAHNMRSFFILLTYVNIKCTYDLHIKNDKKKSLSFPWTCGKYTELHTSQYLAIRMQFLQTMMKLHCCSSRAYECILFRDTVIFNLNNFQSSSAVFKEGTGSTPCFCLTIAEGDLCIHHKLLRLHEI